MHPRLGCFPCMHKLMIAILMLEGPILFWMYAGHHHNKGWNSRLSEAQVQFPPTSISRAIPHHPSSPSNPFSAHFILLHHPHNSRPALRALLGMRRGVGLEIVGLVFITGFVVVSACHFFALCSASEVCLRQRKWRIVGYSWFGFGSLGSFLTALLIFIDTFHLNVQQLKVDVTSQLETIPDKSNSWIYLSHNQTNTTNTTQDNHHHDKHPHVHRFSADTLSQILETCVSDLDFFFQAWTDYSEIIPRELHGLVLTRINISTTIDDSQEEIENDDHPPPSSSSTWLWLHPEDLQDLGFCQMFHVKLKAMLMLCVSGILCGLVPLVGSIQMGYVLHPEEHEDGQEDVADGGAVALTKNNEDGPHPEEQQNDAEIQPKKEILKEDAIT